MGFGGGQLGHHHRSIFDEFEAAQPMGGGMGFSSVQTFSGSMGGMGAGGMGMRSSSTSTRFVNGKKITTKRYLIYSTIFNFNRSLGSFDKG